MENGLFVKNDIIINAPVSEVWNALVNPEQTKKYMYGCEALSDWEVGSPLLWSAVWEGEEKVFVKGTILAIEPDRYLAYTTIDPNSTMPDLPENYLTVTYTLTENNGQTTFNVTQGDYTKVPDGEKRYNDAVSAGGWSSIILAIKNLVESVPQM